MLRTPNLNALRMFDAAARHLNFRLASEELSLTQGAVAQQVRQLESNLGLKLFHRKARGLELTTVGKTYHTSIRRAFALIDEATKKLGSVPRSITISVTPSFASKWLVPRLSEFTALHPDIDIKTVASEALANFQSDEIDVAIRQGKPPFGSSVKSELLARLDLCAVCSPDFARKIPPINEVKDFANHPLIQDGHAHWQTLFDENQLEASHRMLKFNQTALAVDAAANGQGIALAPKILIESDVSQGKLKILWQDHSQDQDGYYAVWLDKSGANPDRDLVVDWVLSKTRRD